MSSPEVTGEPEGEPHGASEQEVPDWDRERRERTDTSDESRIAPEDDRIPEDGTLLGTAEPHFAELPPTLPTYLPPTWDRTALPSGATDRRPLGSFTPMSPIPSAPGTTNTTASEEVAYPAAARNELLDRMIGGPLDDAVRIQELRARGLSDRDIARQLHPAELGEDHDEVEEDAFDSINSALHGDDLQSNTTGWGDMDDSYTP